MGIRKIIILLVTVTIALSACAQPGESNSSSPSATHATTNSPAPQQSIVTVYASPQPTLSTISTPTVSTVEPTQQSPTVSATPNTSCTSKTRAEAVDLAISMQNRKTVWQEVTTNGDNYSPCAELSWITISEGPCCTVMQPAPILLSTMVNMLGLQHLKRLALCPRYHAFLRIKLRCGIYTLKKVSQVLKHLA